MHASSEPDRGRSSSCCSEQRIETSGIVPYLLRAARRRRRGQRVWLIWSPCGWSVL